MSARAYSVPGPVLPHAGRVAGLVVLACAVATFHVWTRTRVVQEGYRLASVQQEHTRLASERDRLVLEVEALTTPRTLEAFARTKLGMAPPDPGPVWAGRGSGVEDHLSGTAEPALFPGGSSLDFGPRRGPTLGMSGPPAPTSRAGSGPHPGSTSSRDGAVALRTSRGAQARTAAR